MTDMAIESYKAQVLSQWRTELHDRIIPQNMAILRDCRMVHPENDFSDFDIKLWIEIDKLRHVLGKDTIDEKCLLTRAKEALDKREFGLASDLQKEIQVKVEELICLYERYKKNIL